MSRGAPRPPVAALTAVLVVAGAAAWGVFHVQSTRAADERARVVSTGMMLLEQRISELHEAAKAFGAQLARSGPTGSTAADAFTARVVLDAGLRPVGPAAVPSQVASSAVLNDPGLRLAAQLAVDGGDAVATTAGSGSSTTTVVLWPLFDGQALTTEQRRAKTMGWVLAALPLSAVEDDVNGPLAALDSRVQVVGPGPAAAGAVDDVLHATYDVRSGPLHTGKGLPVAAAIGVLLMGLFLVLGRARALQHQHDDEQQVLDLQRQLGLLADLGATAQAGLDVSLTLPAVLAQLQSGLQLSHLVVRAGPGAGTELLALGDRHEKGTTSAYPLHRALRTIGTLEVTSRRPVSAENQQTLLAAADIIAGFLHNSELFEREQLAVARLQNLDRLKDDFLGTVSHELRTPLAIIVGFLSMLRSRYRKMTDDERAAALATVSNHATALTALVNDLLDFVTDRRGSDQLNIVPLPLSPAVGEIVERFQPLFTDHRLILALDEGTVVATDARALERILTNLLSNAAKYSPGGTEIEVSVRMVEDGGAVMVRDHGPGIADEDREFVFERFYRGSTDAARGTRGTGIGLTIVKTWLELVGARLEVRSEPGNGTEMTVVFPKEQGSAIDEAGHIVWRDVVPMQSREVLS